jgi:hypothetical protein
MMIYVDTLMSEEHDDGSGKALFTALLQAVQMPIYQHQNLSRVQSLGSAMKINNIG